MGFGWETDGKRMGLGWVLDGTRMGLGWDSDGTRLGPGWVRGEDGRAAARRSPASPLWAMMRVRQETRATARQPEGARATEDVRRAGGERELVQASAARRLRATPSLPLFSPSLLSLSPLSLARADWVYPAVGDVGAALIAPRGGGGPRHGGGAGLRPVGYVPQGPPRRHCLFQVRGRGDGGGGGGGGKGEGTRPGPGRLARLGPIRVSLS